MRSKHAIWNKTYEGHENKRKCENTTYFPQIMAYTNFERTVKRINLTRLFYSWSVLQRIKPTNWFFSAYIKNQNFKKWQNEDDLDRFLNGLKFMRNRVINPMLLIMAFCFVLSHSPKSISFSSQSVNIRALAKVLILMTGVFPVWSLNNFFIFLNRSILFPECS